MRIMHMNSVQARFAQRQARSVRQGAPPSGQWTTQARRHDIGELCARYGGGGHAVVGGVTLRADELPRARQTLASLVADLTTAA